MSKNQEYLEATRLVNRLTAIHKGIVSQSADIYVPGSGERALELLLDAKAHRAVIDPVRHVADEVRGAGQRYHWREKLSRFWKQHLENVMEESKARDVQP